MNLLAQIEAELDDVASLVESGGFGDMDRGDIAHSIINTMIDALLSDDVVARAAKLVPAHQIEPEQTVRYVAGALAVSLRTEGQP